MKTIRNILGGLFVAMMALGGGAVRADEPKDTPTKSAPAKTGKKYNPEELLELFETLGYNTKVGKDKAGEPIFIDLEVPHGDYIFSVRISWNKEQTHYYLRATLAASKPNTPMAPEMLKEMLLQNGFISTGMLYYTELNDGTGLVVLAFILPNEGLTPAILRQKIAGFGSSLHTAYLAREKVEKALAEAKAKAQAKAESNPLVP